MIEDGKLDIGIVPAEKESAYKVVFEGREITGLGDRDDYLRNWQTISRREQANLDIANDRKDEFTAFGDIWARAHFCTRGLPRPKSIYERNQGNRGGKFCSAVVEMPAVTELDKFLKEMGEDYDEYA